ncbi:MAG: 50S ribosomal protein L15 [Candidatus Uhrbacteria bacterium]
MPYGLHNLKPAIGSRKRARRLGRGHGSGRGKTAGRGTKGQKARAGGRGGLKRLGMRHILLAQPKLRGFRSLRPKSIAVNVGELERAFFSGALVTTSALVASGLVDPSKLRRSSVKVLGDGNLTKTLSLKGVAVSASAKAKIEAAGGRIEP